VAAVTIRSHREIVGEILATPVPFGAVFQDEKAAVGTVSLTKSSGPAAFGAASGGGEA
jgi:hypothetical protein